MTPDNNTAAILLSRQPLRPTAQTGWVMQARLAVRSVKDRGMTLCSSVGMQTWEMVTSLAVSEGVPLRLILPYNEKTSFDRQCHEALGMFDLRDDAVSFVSSGSPGGRLKRPEILRQRDRVVVESADLLIPVSIRGEGGMTDLIQQAAANGGNVNRQFEIPFTDRSEPLAYKIDSLRLRADLDEIAAPYLTHWTRTTNSAWPDERPVDYYRAILATDTYPRTGLKTLEHILQGRTVVGSDKNMPGKKLTVSFSALLPSELIPLMKWRARFRQMSFEPYGIGIRTVAAERLGICPVRYYQKPIAKADIPQPEWLSQSAGEITDWRREKEYRHLGDLDLSQIDNEDLCAFCLTPEEAVTLEEKTGIRAVSFYSL